MFLNHVLILRVAAFTKIQNYEEEHRTHYLGSRGLFLHLWNEIKTPK